MTPVEVIMLASSKFTTSIKYKYPNLKQILFCILQNIIPPINHSLYEIVTHQG
jgi:hypothetical protein